MGRRIVYGYLGAVASVLLLIPFALVAPLDGHFLMFMILLSFPFGMLLGMWYADRQRRCDSRAALARFAAGLAITFLVAGVIGNASLPGSLVTKGWVLIPVVSPLVVGFCTEYLWRRKPG